MPTILELFKGSPLDKAVQPDRDTVIEQEFSGIRPRSAVELNNPLLYGNEAIRIATRSTSSVEKMKQGTGGSAADGGLIGKGLGAITGGKFGKFVFGGKVTSLNQARDGVNTRLGIPVNTIPTYVYNTGGLQAGIEPDTMVTIGKIKNDATGTLLGQFLKKTGGGTPQTIGKQLLGGGISLGKSKLRTALFGNQTSMGSNTANAIDSFSGVDSGGKTPANGGWEYSSNLPYSKQISLAKFNTKAVDGYVEGTSQNIVKKVSQLQLDAKKKLGEATANATASLKQRLKGSDNKSELDKHLDDAKQAREKNPTPSSETPYTTTIGDYKNEGGKDKFTRIDLSLVSPVYGVDRKKTKGKYGTSEYAFQDVHNQTGIYSPYNPTDGKKYSNKNKANWDNVYGLTNKSDDITLSNIEGSPNEHLENMDLIPFWIQSVRSNETAHFRGYITGLSETSSPSWNTNKFFGNPYSFYTYDGVERSVQFNLKVVALNQTELAKNWVKLEFLTKQTYPIFSTPSPGQTYTQPPIIKFRIGSLYDGKIGYIESLSYTFDENTPWETNSDGLLVPKFVDVAITIKFIEYMSTENTLYNTLRDGDTIKMINQKNGAGGSFTTDTVASPDSNPIEPITPPKIDKKGKPATPPKEGGVNKTQKNTKGKTETTPKQKENSGGLDYSDKAISEWARKSEENTKKLMSKGVPEITASFIGRQENVDINSVTKLNETTWYYERPYLGGKGTFKGTFNQKNAQINSYSNWVSDYNKGVDVLKKL
jgi:hypothetical protein